MTTEPDVAAVHRDRALALLDNGVTVPVTNWIGPGGLDCDPEDAITAVAGSPAVGWFAIDLTKFKTIDVPLI